MTEAKGLARKRLGQFYTPVGEAASFAQWAVRTGNERILEPSAGDGALLLAALDRVKDIGGQSRTALACDVDDDAVQTLQAIVGEAAEIKSMSFFDLDPRDHAPVDVVLANPPFTRNHLLDRTAKRELRQRYSMNGAAGLWAYFVLHARSFLRPGGRMLVVVPAAATFTSYADDLMRRLQSEFRSLSLVELPTKPVWSAAADERGAVILAEGYQGGPAASVARGVWDFTTHSPQRWRPLQLPPSFHRLAEAATPLGTLAHLSIGAVTGANRVFLLDGADAAAMDNEDILPIVSRARHVRGLSISREELEEMAEAGERTWLLAPRSLGQRGGPVRKRLARIDRDSRRQTAWFNKRTPWWAIAPLPKCDAVFTYMNDLGPRLALVDQGIVCSNTLHCVRFVEGLPLASRLSAVSSFVSTFGQLSAELQGRTYGGGVLKFELKEARAFPVIVNERLAKHQVDTLDGMIRRGEAASAREFADELLLKPLLGTGWRAATTEMSEILNQIRAARRRGDYRLSKET